MLELQIHMIHNSCPQGSLGLVGEDKLTTRNIFEYCSKNIESVLLTHPGTEIEYVSRFSLRRLLSSTSKDVQWNNVK